MKKQFTASEKVFMWTIFVMMALLALSILMPIVWAMYSSVKTRLDYALNMLGLPQEIKWENYVNVYEHIKVTITNEQGQKTFYFWGMFGNSLLYSGLDGVISVLMPGLMGYIVAMYNFKGKGFIQTTNIIMMIIPIVGSLPAYLRMLTFFGCYDNLVLFILTQNSAFGFNFLIFYGAFKSLSWTYAEAAFLDGASHFKVMIKIYLPMMLPTFAMMYVLAFVGSWNKYEQFMLYLPSYPNLFLGMYYFQNNASINYATQPEILAGLLLVAIPSAILYLSSQRLLRARFIVGGLKG